jgi:hypothetical protein
MRLHVVAAALISALGSVSAAARVCDLCTKPVAPPIIIQNALDYSAGRRRHKYRDTTSPYRMSRSRVRRAIEKRTKRAQRLRR